METSPAPNATDRGFMSQRIDCGIDPGYSPGQLMLVATADKCRWLSDLPQQKFLISLTLQVQHQLREIGDGGDYSTQPFRYPGWSVHHGTGIHLKRGRNGHGRKVMAKSGPSLSASMSLSLMVNWAELGTRFPIFVPWQSSMFSIILGRGNLCFAMEADLWEQLALMAEGDVVGKYPSFLSPLSG